MRLSASFCFLASRLKKVLRLLHSSAAAGLGDDGMQEQVAGAAAGVSAGQVIGTRGDDEDGSIKWGVELQGRIGRGEARLKGDVEDWTGPQARSYAVGVVLHRPHLPICNVHGILLH